MNEITEVSMESSIEEAVLKRSVWPRRLFVLFNRVVLY